MQTQLTIFLYIVIFLYGIVIGSFLNVCILRIPRKENIASHSHCIADASWGGVIWFLYFLTYFYEADAGNVGRRYPYSTH